jgi:hypothetical protein
VDLTFDAYKLRNMQARVIALCLEHIILAKIDSGQLEELFSTYFDPLASKIQE